MKLIKLVIVFLICLLPFSIQAMDHTKPLMLKDKYYKEYWEQLFLFDDGTLVSSQFLAANFPWPVGKEHGIMVSSVITPDGKKTIIKNGRDFGKWGFDPEKFDIFIHTHRLKSDGENYNHHIGTVGRNVVNVKGKMNIPSLDHERVEIKKGYMDSATYLPYFKGEGDWIIQHDKKLPFETGAGKVQGFGIHAVYTQPVDHLLKSWYHVSGLQGADETQFLPFLSAIEKKDSSHDIVLTLKNSEGEITRFSNVSVEYKEILKGKKKSSYPTVIEVKAENGDEKLTGTFRLTRKIDHFNFNDHLNFIERSFTRSRASITNYRYIANYELSYVTASGIQHLTGKALSEYQDVQPPKKKKRSRKKKKR